MTMVEYHDAAASARPTPEEPIEVLCVDDDPDYLGLIEAHLSGHDDFSVRTETASSVAADAVDQVDCVVSDYDMPGMDGLDLHAEVRERSPTLPFVLFTGSARKKLAEEFPDDIWTEFLRKDDPETAMPILASRIRRLVGHHRTLRAANRTLTAIEATRDGIAVVGPDGTITFANRVFASRLGVEPDELAGRPWQTCFPDDEVERLESTAIETVRDNWQWTGGCRYVTADGEEFAAQTRVAGLDDGSLVFCLTDTDE
ncbi:response regulator [Halosimplex aquaticum]|uniref:Response regulator n=1 Tax=Halosimplex aquaticum TaxID=3026162 RepID=A0ABD5Y0C4_9EURY|nr:response regulator [Halosimplex aquaticum]